jgi:hypothetical protein
MQDSVTLAVDHVAKVTKLAEEAADADTVARAAHERRDHAIRDAVDAGHTPKTLDRAGVGLSESSLYRIVGHAD